MKTIRKAFVCVVLLRFSAGMIKNSVPSVFLASLGQLKRAIKTELQQCYSQSVKYWSTKYPPVSVGDMFKVTQM